MVATSKTELRCDVCGNLSYTNERLEWVTQRRFRRPIEGLGDWVVLTDIHEETSYRHLLSCSDRCHMAFVQVEAEWIVAEAKKGRDRVINGDMHGARPLSPGGFSPEVALLLLAQAREMLQGPPLLERVAQRLEAG